MNIAGPQGIVNSGEMKTETVSVNSGASTLTGRRKCFILSNCKLQPTHSLLHDEYNKLKDFGSALPMLNDSW